MPTADHDVPSPLDHRVADFDLIGEIDDVIVSGLELRVARTCVQ